jgi:hypothetical protein
MREYDLIADWYWTDRGWSVGVAEALAVAVTLPLSRAFSISVAAAACRLPNRSSTPAIASWFPQVVVTRSVFLVFGKRINAIIHRSSECRPVRESSIE